jgi:hypothetical protein
MMATATQLLANSGAMQPLIGVPLSARVMDIVDRDTHAFVASSTQSTWACAFGACMQVGHALFEAMR